MVQLCKVKTTWELGGREGVGFGGKPRAHVSQGRCPTCRRCRSLDWAGSWKAVEEGGFKLWQRTGYLEEEDEKPGVAPWGNPNPEIGEKLRRQWRLSRPWLEYRREAEASKVGFRKGGGELCTVRSSMDTPHPRELGHTEGPSGLNGRLGISAQNEERSTMLSLATKPVAASHHPTLVHPETLLGLELLGRVKRARSQMNFAKCANI